MKARLEAADIAYFERALALAPSNPAASRQRR
jgi:hypothetical protein